MDSCHPKQTQLNAKDDWEPFEASLSGIKTFLDLGVIWHADGSLEVGF